MKPHCWTMPFNISLMLTLTSLVIGSTAVPAVAMPEAVLSQALGEESDDSNPLNEVTRVYQPDFSNVDFSGTGRTRNRVGGASRSGGCGGTDLPMMPLVPVSAQFGGHTTEAQPSFWVYVPYTLTENSPVTFALHDETGGDVYQKTFVTTAEPGIYQITLPPAVTLESDTYYDWYVLIYCNDPLRQDVPSFASGWVQRVDSSGSMSETELAALSPAERGVFYANEMLWYDAIATLGDDLQSTSPQPATRTAWESLLNLPSVQLGNYAEQPLMLCCDVEQITDLP